MTRVRHRAPQSVPRPRPRRARVGGAALFLVALAIGGVAAAAPAPAPDFEAVPVFESFPFDQPVLLRFLPGGRKLIAEKAGRVWLADSLDHVASVPFLDLRSKVLSNGDRGLLGLALDPDFATAPWVYVVYAVDPDSNDVDDEASTWCRVERYRIAPGDSWQADLATREVLIGATWSEGIASPVQDHGIGTLQFGSDGTLLIGSGDGAHADRVDGGGDDPAAFGPGRSDSTDDVGAFRAQLLTSLNGKILRVERTTGHGLPSNPYYDDPLANRSRVWASGLRNPFRFTVLPGTGSADPAAGDPGTLLVADVGWYTYEELNRAAGGGHNFGWPCREGPAANDSYPLYSPQPDCGCPSIGTASNPAPAEDPLLWWSQTDASRSFPAGHKGSSAVAGPWLDRRAYPDPYREAFVVGDFAQGWIQAVRFDSTGAFGSAHELVGQAEGPVSIELDPDTGELWWVAIVTGQVYRLRYQPGNHSPVVAADVQPRAGYAPLSAQFTVSSASDADGDSLRFAWDFGDGAGAGGPDTTHVYALEGTYTATLTVTDERGATTLRSFAVVVGAVPPPGRILAPYPGAFYDRGDTLLLATQPLDPEGGPVEYAWEVDLAHDEHVHPAVWSDTGLVARFAEATPQDGDRYHYRIRLIARRDGLATADTVEVWPRLDLRPGGVDFGGAFIPPDTEVPFEFTIANPSRFVAAATHWCVRLQDSIVAQGTAPIVAAGDSVTVSGMLAPLPAGPAELFFDVDCDSELVEWDEASNLRAFDLVVSGLVGVGGGAGPAPSALLPPAPNPANGPVRLAYRLARAGTLRLAVYTATGRHVRTLLAGPASAGEGQATWDGRDAAGRSMRSGVYFVRLLAPDRTEARRVILLGGPESR